MRAVALSFVAATFLRGLDLEASAQSGASVRVVNRGQTLKVDYSYTVDPQCHVLRIPTINVLAAPQAGTVLTGVGEDFPSFPSTNIRFSCDRHRVHSAEVFYRAAPEGVGSGPLSLEVVSVDGTAKRYDYVIDVR